MKKALALVVAVAFAAGVVGFAQAQTQTAPPAPEKKIEKMEKAGETKAEKMEKAGEMKAKKMPAKNANGIVKVASADSIVVAGKEKVKGSKVAKDVEWTFAVDAKTIIKKGGKAITASDLKAGDAVHVRFVDHDGKAVAQAVMVKAGGKDKKAEAMMKKDEMKKDEMKKTEKK